MVKRSHGLKQKVSGASKKSSAARDVETVVAVTATSKRDGFAMKREKFLQSALK